MRGSYQDRTFRHTAVRHRMLVSAFPTAICLITIAASFLGATQFIETGKALAEDNVKAGASASAQKINLSVKVTPQARAEAKDIWEQRCQSCHGAAGLGDGPGAFALAKKPKNFHSQEWQKSVTNDEIARAIVYGGASVGLNDAMQPNTDLASKPEVVAALVEHVRELGK